jgi:hypothetical protein
MNMYPIDRKQLEKAAEEDTAQVEEDQCPPNFKETRDASILSWQSE